MILMHGDRTGGRLLIFAILLAFSTGCSVGARVSIESESLDYPVSQSSSVYVPNGELVNSGSYELISDFSYRFKKWGISGLNINSKLDISEQLNTIIIEKEGDAIVNLDISIRNTSANSLMLFFKTAALMGTVAGTAVSITEPSMGNALFATGSLAAFLFTPANVDIEIRGTVIRFIDPALHN